MILKRGRNPEDRTLWGGKMETSKISFIGLGAMGQPMASNIVRKGSPITVYDIDPTRMEPVVALGAASLADALDGAGIVITMLSATRHVERVVQGLLTHS
jgi:4-hydroxybutyrate dehydrogenase/sulfolactaldehyde 3-reductase